MHSDWSTFYWSPRAGPAPIGLLWAVLLNVEIPHISISAIPSQKKCNYNSGILMFERKQLLLVKPEVGCWKTVGTLRLPLLPLCQTLDPTNHAGRARSLHGTAR